MPNWAKNGSPVSGAPAVQSAAPAGAASKSAAAMPAAAQEIDRFKEPSPGSRIDRRYRRAGGTVKVRACDHDYRGGRTRWPRTAHLRPELGGDLGQQLPRGLGAPRPELARELGLGRAAVAAARLDRG